MGWQPAYNAYGTEPLIRQLMAIINRDIQSALDFVSGSPGSLRPFATYQLAESPTMNYPAVLLIPMAQTFDPQTVGVAKETVTLFCGVAAEHQKPDGVAILIQQYAMAVWHVLAAASLKTSGDFLLADLPLPATAYGPAQLTSGMAPGVLKRLFVEQPEFAELRQTAKSMFVKAASITIEADLFEA